MAIGKLELEMGRWQVALGWFILADFESKPAEISAPILITRARQSSETQNAIRLKLDLTQSEANADSRGTKSKTQEYFKAVPMKTSYIFEFSNF